MANTENHDFRAITKYQLHLDSFYSKKNYITTERQATTKSSYRLSLFGGFTVLPE